MGNEQSGGDGGYRADYARHAPAAARVESDAEKAERLQRAAAYEDKVKKFQRKDTEQLKQENWKKYDAIGKPLPGEAPSPPSANSSTTSASIAASTSSPSLSASASASAVPPPPTHWNTSTAASRTNSTAQMGYPGAITNHVQPAQRRAVTGGSGYVGASSSSSSSPPNLSHPASSPAPAPADPNAARAARAAAMTAKTSKMKHHHKAGGKSDQWDTYRQLEALEQQKMAAVPANANPRSEPGVYDEVDMEEKAAASTANMQALLPPPPPESDAAASAFYQQMLHLLSLAQQMPPSSLALLIRILSNLLKADGVADGHKFRKLKLDGERMQREVVQVDGALDILYAVGFERQAVEGGEESLVCPVGTNLQVAQLAFDKLTQVQAFKQQGAGA